MLSELGEMEVPASGRSPDDLDLRPVDRAYNGIRQLILSGSLNAGEHLGEELLADLTATSCTPVREALRRLAAEGLVVVAANRRSYVAEFDPFEADAVFEIRSRLESFAAELAAAKIGAAGIERLRSRLRSNRDIGSSRAPRQPDPIPQPQQRISQNHSRGGRLAPAGHFGCCRDCDPATASQTLRLGRAGRHRAFKFPASGAD